MARKVLIADDSPTIQKKAGGILTGEGYEVVSVSNGVAAVKKLPAVMPLVVLADVAMPGKDGYEVCEFVKKHDTLKTVPVLLVFSESDPVEEERAARAHADGRISKPFNNPEELISIVGRFAAMAEAAVAAPPVPQPMSQAPPVYVTEPVDAEPEPETRQEMPDMSAFSGGIGIGDVTPEEQFSPPLSHADLATEVAPVAEMSPAEIASPEFPPSSSEPPPLPGEPVLVEEAAPPPAAAEEEPPATERTMLFHAPAEIAEPVLSDESVMARETSEAAASAADTVAPPSETATPPVEAEVPGVAATTLESFSLRDVESGQVHFPADEEGPLAPQRVATPEPAAAPAATAQPAQTPEPAAKRLDEAQIFSIVHSIVVKMSPPALSPQMVEDIARRFTDEVIQDLHSEP